MGFPEVLTTLFRKLAADGAPALIPEVTDITIATGMKTSANRGTGDGIGSLPFSGRALRQSSPNSNGRQRHLETAATGKSHPTAGKTDLFQRGEESR